MVLSIKEIREWVLKKYGEYDRSIPKLHAKLKEYSKSETIQGAAFSQFLRRIINNKVKGQRSSKNIEEISKIIIKEKETEMVIGPVSAVEIIEEGDTARIVDLYDELAQGGLYETKYPMKVADRMLKLGENLGYVHPESVEKVLDIGCGPGNATIMAARRYPNAEVIGIDLSENQLREAEKRAREEDLKITFLNMNWNKLGEKFGENYFDVIISNIAPFDISALSNAKYILKPNGVMLLTYHGKDAYREFYGAYERSLNSSKTLDVNIKKRYKKIRRLYYTKEEIESKFKEVGLQIGNVIFDRREVESFDNAEDIIRFLYYVIPMLEIPVGETADSRLPKTLAPLILHDIIKIFEDLGNKITTQMTYVIATK
jgi:SAM-dependent methyltransferase